MFRFLQGAGGALASAVVLGMITTLYPEPRTRAKAIGVYSFTQAARKPLLPLRIFRIRAVSGANGPTAAT